MSFNMHNVNLLGVSWGYNVKQFWLTNWRNQPQSASVVVVITEEKMKFIIDIYFFFFKCAFKRR